MAVTVDATGTEQTGNTTSTSLTYTGITVGSVSNGALVLLAGISSGGTAPTGVTATWDNGGTNQAMTLRASQAVGTDEITYVFVLRNPIAGNKNLRIAWTNANEISACAISFAGVDQTSDATAFPNPNSATATSASPSLTITSATGNIPVTSIATGNTLSAPTQTQIYVDNALVQNYGAQRAAGAASVAFGWTITPSTAWAMAGCDVAQVAAGGPALNNQSLVMM